MEAADGQKEKREDRLQAREEQAEKTRRRALITVDLNWWEGLTEQRVEGAAQLFVQGEDLVNPWRAGGGN